jgi:hypothetical protein
MTDDVTPFPRALASSCCRCSGPVHIYEADLQDTPEGLVCGDCTRVEQKRQGRDPRAIDKHFKWAPGHDPNDQEADPDSGFVYVTLQPTEAPAEPRDKDTIKGGPPSGTICFNCLTNRGTQVETRLVAAVSPYDMLAGTGFKQTEGTTKTKEKDIITICPVCSSATHWREREFKRARSKFHVA